MKLSHLRDILAVSERGSLRAAGRYLGVAQPAITRSIREIEHELGVPLFERHAKGVRLTAMGEVFVRRAATIDSELRRAREEINQLRGRATGQVAIAMSTAPLSTAARMIFLSVVELPLPMPGISEWGMVNSRSTPMNHCSMICGSIMAPVRSDVAMLWM